MKRLIPITLLLLLGAAGLFGCAPSEEVAEPLPNEAETHQTEETEIAAIAEVADVEDEQEAPTSGFLLKLNDTRHGDTNRRSLKWSRSPAQ